LFSRHARSVVLLLYETPDAVKHGWHIELDPEQHRTGDIWLQAPAGIGFQFGKGFIQALLGVIA
ncbi:MAG: hypothetical protein P8Z78_12285, partial [Gammaproteobacteria bacterium]